MCTPHTVFLTGLLWGPRMSRVSVTALTGMCRMLTGRGRLGGGAVVWVLMWRWGCRSSQRAVRPRLAPT